MCIYTCIWIYMYIYIYTNTYCLLPISPVRFHIRFHLRRHIWSSCWEPERTSRARVYAILQLTRRKQPDCRIQMWRSGRFEWPELIGRWLTSENLKSILLWYRYGVFSTGSVIPNSQDNNITKYRWHQMPHRKWPELMGRKSRTENSGCILVVV